MSTTGWDILGRVVDGVLAPLKAWWFWVFVALLIGAIKSREILDGIRAAAEKLP